MELLSEALASVMPVCLLILVGVQQLWCWYGMVTSFNKPYIYTYASCLLLEAGVLHTPIDMTGLAGSLVLFERWPVGPRGLLIGKAADHFRRKLAIP